jgi:hypothetical protein
MNYTDVNPLNEFSGFIRVSDFAKLYFTGYSRPETATRKFRKRIRESKDLFEMLTASGYDENDRLLAPGIANMIVKAWGPPDAYKRRFSSKD